VIYDTWNCSGIPQHQYEVVSSVSTEHKHKFRQVFVFEYISLFEVIQCCTFKYYDELVLKITQVRLKFLFDEGYSIVCS